jgi:tRNA threonylcarbamoyladenosine modification (KEOPS) complex  Pcc1 subunit
MMVECQSSNKDLSKLVKDTKATSANIYFNVSADDAGSLHKALSSVLRKNRQSIVVVMKSQ